MTNLTPFLNALSTAQKKEKYTTEVQDAANNLDTNTLQKAIDAALAMDETDTLNDEAQVAALSAGFQFATKVVMMLTTAPGPYEKSDLYVFYKVARQEKVEVPSSYDMVKQHLHAEWEQINHYSDQKAQALYVRNVNELIDKYGTRDA